MRTRQEWFLTIPLFFTLGNNGKVSQEVTTSLYGKCRERTKMDSCHHQPVSSTHPRIPTTMSIKEYRLQRRIDGEKAFQQFFNHIDRLSTHLFLLLHFFLVATAIHHSAVWPSSISSFAKTFLQTLACDFLLFPAILYAARWLFMYNNTWWYPVWWRDFLGNLQGGMKGVWREIDELHYDIAGGAPGMAAKEALVDRDWKIVVWMRRYL